MIGKQKAQKLAREERFTWGELLAFVNAGPSNDKMSSVNRAVSISYCRDLFRAIITERPPDEKPKAWRPDIYSRHPGAVKPSHDFLIVTNILRDFHL